MIKKTSLLVWYLLVIFLILSITACGQASSPITTTLLVITPSQVPTSTLEPIPTEIPVPTHYPIQVEPIIIPTVEPTPTPIIFPVEYTVKEGDTVGEISLFYGVPIAYIAMKNNIANVNWIYPGQVLIIPDPNELPEGISDTGKQIVVILSLQSAYAYENGELIKEFLVSTGLPDTPTVQGNYAIYIKFDSTRMRGPGYDLSNVPWTMYFFEGYGFHGTYWHSNFGFPMSHGCVNMKTDEAEWLYNWAPVGTSVLILP